MNKYTFWLIIIFGFTGLLFLTGGTAAIIHWEEIIENIIPDLIDKLPGGA